MVEAIKKNMPKIPLNATEAIIALGTVLCALTVSSLKFADASNPTSVKEPINIVIMKGTI